VKGAVADLTQQEVSNHTLYAGRRTLIVCLGLSVHMSQVHKENLTAVDNALPNRAGLDIEIFGMEGIPEDIAQQHTQRVLTNYHQAQADRQAATGNQTGAGGNAAKKPKLETAMSLKERLAAHKAAKAAGGQGSDSGNGTPTGAGQSQPQNGFVSLIIRFPLAHIINPNEQQAGSPPYQAYDQAYAPPPTTTTYGAPPSFSQAPAPAAYQPPQIYGQAAPPLPQYLQASPYAQPPQPSFQQQPPLSYTPAFSPPPFQQPSFPGQPYGAPMMQNGGPPRPYGAGSPMQPFQPHRTGSPSQNGTFPQPVRTGSVMLSSAPGLPQRPAVGAPPVNAFQFQQMHQGQIPASQSHVTQQYPPQNTPANGHVPSPQPHTASQAPVRPEAPSSENVDELISSASKQADEKDAVQPAQAQITSATPAERAIAPPLEEAAETKAGKKEKEKAKPTRLVYSDNETSPEEKMALLSRYKFTPTQHSAQ